MKWFLYSVILAFALLTPVDRLDVAKLEPVEAVVVYMEDGQVVLQTDTDDIGRGTTAAEALEDMKKNTPSVIYLDTAEYLLVAENAQGQGQQLREYLKPSVLVETYRGGSVKKATQYAEVHGKCQKLKDWRPPEKELEK